MEDRYRNRQRRRRNVIEDEEVVVEKRLRLEADINNYVER
jgi:hypothetical protein